jgi:hypothetical protein
MTATLTETNANRLAQPPRGAGARRRRIQRSAAGLGAAALLVGLGTVMATNASFAKTYVKDQLSQQHIVFSPVERLTAEEKATPCLVKWAGQPITTGKQAECYANDYIGLHLKSIANGQTYADVSGQHFVLTAQVEAARQANDPTLADMQQKLAGLTGQRNTLFQGETSRGLLLTSFGFSDLGAKAGQAATVAYGAAGLVALLSVAGLVYAFVKPRTESVGR